MVLVFREGDELSPLGLTIADIAPRGVRVDDEFGGAGQGTEGDATWRGLHELQALVGLAQVLH